MIIEILLALIVTVSALTLVPGWLRRRRGTGDDALLGPEYRGSNQKVQGDPIEAARDFIDYRGKDHG